MNKQTRSLYKKQLSTRFNKGVAFDKLSGKERLDHPEFTIVSFPFGRQPRKKRMVQKITRRVVAAKIEDDGGLLDARAGS